MVIGTGQQTIIDLRDTVDVHIERAYCRGMTVEDAAGSIIFKTDQLELIKEPTGLLWLSGVIVETDDQGLIAEHRWDFEFLPNNGVDVRENDSEIIDIQTCTSAAQKLLKLVSEFGEGQAA